MANLRRRVGGDGRVTWQAQVRRRGQQRTETFRTKSAAKKWAIRVEAELELLRVEGYARKRLADAIDRYLGTDDEPGADLLEHAETDARNVKQRLGWWKEQLGKRWLRDLSVSLIRDTLDDLDCSGPTRNRYLASLSKVLTTATREWQWMPSNPCRSIKRRREGDGRVRHLSDAERAKLLEKCQRWPRLHAAVLFAMRTGCRLGEIEALRASDVIAERAVARIQHSKSGDRRTVHVPADALEALYRLKMRKDGLVFGMLDRRHWREAKKAAGLDDWRFHDLRHDYASNIGRKGASESQIAAALGHKSWAMARRYTHISPDALADMMRDLIEPPADTPSETPPTPASSADAP